MEFLKIVFNLLETKGYECIIRKDPRKLAGQGMFEFQHYQWAKIYPPGFQQFCNDKFSYIVGFADTLHFHMMGIKGFQNMKPSLDASKACWTEIDISSSNYDNVVEAFGLFDKKYRGLFINTAIELGITELLPFKKKIDMNKFSDILNIKPQIILQGPPGTGKTYTAKDIAENVIFGCITADKSEQKKKLDNCEQFEIIQFHPAYSYEDFVRGITAKGNGTAVEYKTENKTLGEFTLLAAANLDDSKKKIEDLSKEQWVAKEIAAFAESVQDKIDSEGKYPINETVSILAVDKDAFRYKGDWDVQNMQRMKFSDTALEYLHNAANRQEIKVIPGLSGRGREHSTYDFKLLEKFRAFLKGRKPFSETGSKVDRKNYVFIIDEINRANLPAVLGELIYALEYRDEKVTSIYDIDEDKSIQLPSNLYIIGTMNTADRSVGHIDYAIRRRFAFVDILPNKEPVTPLALPLFRQVSELFIKNFDTLDWTKPELERSEELAADFRPEDVWIGHSYFISSKTTEEEIKTELQLKLDYEIKPLLKEYLKDGLLSPKAEEKIKKLHV